MRYCLSGLFELKESLHGWIWTAADTMAQDEKKSHFPCHWKTGLAFMIRDQSPPIPSDIKATSTRRRLQTQTMVKAYFYLRSHEDDHRLRSVFKFIHFGGCFRIYAFTVSVFIVFVWTEGLNAWKSLHLLSLAFTIVFVWTGPKKFQGTMLFEVVHFDPVC